MGAVVAAGPSPSAVAPAAWSPRTDPISYIPLGSSGTKMSVVFHMAADRSGSNSILEADWLQNPAVVAEFR